MTLQETDVIAILIALTGSCFVIVWTIMSNRRLLRQNKDLRRVIKILQSQKKDKY